MDHSKTEAEIALNFFKMLKNAGFGVKLKDYSASEIDMNNVDINDTNFYFELLDSHDKGFINFDFSKGNFYRISGIDSTGWYGDEVDLVKYD